MSVASHGPGSGFLADNLVYFVRALREAGLPLGPGAVLCAIEAVEAVSIGSRADFRVTLHAVLVTRHEETVLFDQAFDLFWKRRGYLDKLIALMSPTAKPKSAKPNKAQAGATRVSDAMLKQKAREEQAAPSLDLDARFSVSAAEILRTRDFAQMTAAEIARANAAIARLALPHDAVRIRRLGPDPQGALVDARRSFRKVAAGGRRLDRHRPARPHRAASAHRGAMRHLGLDERLHAGVPALPASAVGAAAGAQLFVRHAAHQRHPGLAGARHRRGAAECSSAVLDWSGGTRIAGSLHRFNKDWSRRVLGQGATVILFTDGLEREETDELSAEMRRLRRFARRVVWVNPLLRFGGFEAKALGIRAMLPFVDEFRPIHNLAAMTDLCSALGHPDIGAADPRRWLRRAA